MATYTHTMALSSGGALNSPAMILTDANAQRIIAAHRLRYGLPTNSTAQAVWTAIANDVFDVLKTRTLNQERETAQAAVVVPDLPLT